jgi:anti-sigma B factor antagonist
VTSHDEPAGLATPFDIQVGGAPEAPVVTVSGEIDVATSPRLRNELTALLDAGATRLTLEFAGVSFIDSSGLGVLVGLYKRLREDNSGTVRIVDAQPPVRKVFEITGLGTALLDD